MEYGLSDVIWPLSSPRKKKATPLEKKKTSVEGLPLQFNLNTPWEVGYGKGGSQNVTGLMRNWFDKKTPNVGATNPVK